MFWWSLWNKKTFTTLFKYLFLKMPYMYCSSGNKIILTRKLQWRSECKPYLRYNNTVKYLHIWIYTILIYSLNWGKLEMVSDKLYLKNIFQIRQYAILIRYKYLLPSKIRYKWKYKFHKYRLFIYIFRPGIWSCQNVHTIRNETRFTRITSILFGYAILFKLDFFFSILSCIWWWWVYCWKMCVKTHAAFE